MNILINSIPLTQLTTGIQRYVRCLYTELQSHPDVSVSYFGRCSCRQEMPVQTATGMWTKCVERIWQLPTPLVVGMRVLDRMMFEERLRRSVGERKVDVYHEPANFPPILKNTPVVLTVHDLSLIKHGEKHPRERVRFNEIFFERRLPYAAHIITVSHFTRDQVVKDLGIPPHKVTAIHNAHGAAFTRRPKSDIVRVLDRQGWPREYLLFVGTLEPRKNLPLLIKALSLMKTKIPLILAGWTGWGNRDWWREVERFGLQDRVIPTGYIDEEILACLYGGASALVYPSLYEGFGLPVLEAMACGCPVLCSNSTSLPEVAGGAAILLDPHDPEVLAHSLEKVIHDSSLRQHLITAGLERARMFSWRKTALETLKVFAAVTGNPH